MTMATMSRALARRHYPGIQERRRLVTGLLFISPWILGFLAFQVYPFFASLYYSFTFYSVLGSPKWIGLQNYQNLAADPRFRTALFNSTYFAVFAVPLGAIVAILLAMLLNTNVRGRSVFRTIFYLPSIAPVVATSIVWLWMFNPRAGIVNYI